MSRCRSAWAEALRLTETGGDTLMICQFFHDSLDFGFQNRWVDGDTGIHNHIGFPNSTSRSQRQFRLRRTTDQIRHAENPFIQSDHFEVGHFAAVDHKRSVKVVDEIQ